MYKIKRVVSSFMKRNKKSLMNLVCTSLLACGLASAVKSCELKIYDDLNEKKITSVEDNVKEYVYDIEESYKDDFLVAVGSLEEEGKYRFCDRVLYDEEDNVVDLNGNSKYLYFKGTNVSKESLDIMNLQDAKTEVLFFSSSSLTDDCISSFPSTLKVLSLKKCNFLTDLSSLPKYCPNLEYLYLDGTTIDSLDFIYELPKLKKLKALETLCVTEELLEYLDKMGISTNVSYADIELQNELKSIVNNIVSESMSDEEKVKAVCGYVLNRLEYDIEVMAESNSNPISFAFSSGKGVCISFAHLTNALLELAGIESYCVDNMYHIWNLLKIDDKYYYIDTSFMRSSDILLNWFLEKFNIGASYMVDPLISNCNSITPIDSNLTILPEQIKNDVLSLQSSTHKYSYSLSNLSMFELYLLRLLIIAYAGGQTLICSKEILDNQKKLILS